MGQLLYKDSIDNPVWYFEDTYYSTEGRRYVYKWPSKNFSYSVAIHSDDIDNSVRIQIRRWIELNLSETVIYDTLCHDYRWHYHETIKDWQHSYEVQNKWITFHFEDENSYLMFRLAFSNLVKDPTKHHPKYPDHEQWCNMTWEQKEEKRRL